ncbi:hypothetical protein BT63DRAFT_483297 [Microthyrium microscopicum]|uniref:DUF7907 domain-containing protein n=1 Tax=Microthyrium microscopicum TaxID=703497 RepID=A0A6A6TWY0_9PEZI|nr:hypothetical protein BT63DRAFT_483297 [Microthyrium microscopicum]
MLSTILLGICALTASVTAQYTTQSDPFYLVLLSEDLQVNGSTLNACHEGAAIEGLCVGSKLPLNGTTTGFSTFQFNTSESITVPNPDIGETGLLTFTLRGSGFNESEAMSLYPYTASNVALPLFQPGYSQTPVAFDARELLNIQDYIDDTVDPAVAAGPFALYRWYSCKVYYTGYRYTVLSWVYGKYPPQNPTCCKVDVLRVFA